MIHVASRRTTGTERDRSYVAVTQDLVVQLEEESAMLQRMLPNGESWARPEKYSSAYGLG